MVEARLLAMGFSRPERLPDGREVPTLDAAGERRVAADAGLTPRAAQLAALAGGVVPRRYLRNLGSMDLTQQRRLLESRAALVGLGGLGGHLLEGLARAGVGRLRAADGDVFEEHNLNRQLLAETRNMGRPKAGAAQDRAAAVNPAVEVEARHEFLTDATLPDFLAGCHLAIDALGGLDSRQTLQRAAAAARIPLVTGAMAGNSGYVAVVLPGAAGPADFLGRGPAAEASLGTPPASVATIAALMLHEALRLLTGKTSPLAGGMLLVDLEAMRFERVSFT